jgi:hypothetical protein
MQLDLCVGMLKQTMFYKAEKLQKLKHGFLQPSLMQDVLYAIMGAVRPPRPNMCTGSLSADGPSSDGTLVLSECSCFESALIFMWLLSKRNVGKVYCRC